VAGGILAIGKDREGLRDLARPIVALYVGGMGAKGRNFYHDVMVRYGFGDLADAIQERYLAGDREGAAALVPEELLRELTLVGDVAWVRDRVDAWRAAGVTTLLVTPVGPEPLASLRTLAELVHP
jgi:alkanesulfonate monooxygenase SsuD/methylene tetrahydromethanopterin reductase-like flavin-dependent oxidoreductase (luciferase family)